MIFNEEEELKVFNKELQSINQQIDALNLTKNIYINPHLRECLIYNEYKQKYQLNVDINVKDKFEISVIRKFHEYDQLFNLLKEKHRILFNQEEEEEEEEEGECGCFFFGFKFEI